jgi:hydrogenase maturation factor
MSSPSINPDNCVPNPDGSCSICADEAIPGVVESIDTTAATAQVRTGSGTGTVALDLVESVAVGDTLMIHLGFAIGRIA